MSHVSVTASKEQRTKEREDNAQVSPPFIVLHVQPSKELVSDFVLTVLALRGGIRIDEIAAKSLDESTRPRFACLSRRGVEYGEFVVSAVNLQTTKSR